MAKITKQMNVLEAMSMFPKVSAILTQNQIKSIKVFESLEKNILAAGKDPDSIMEQINTAFEESKKPVKMDAETLLNLTEEAADELKKTMGKKGKKGWAVRLLVHSPSPNKYSYAMDFEKRPAKDDVIVEKQGLKFFVNNVHADTIKGVSIEYDKKEGGFRFVKRD